MNNAQHARPVGRRGSHSSANSRCFSVGFLLALSLFGLCLPTAAAAANDYKPSPAIGPSQSFAIADFDGDGQADIATVGPGRTVSYLSQYWVRIRLSNSERQTIPLMAPAGGLLVEPHDIDNGNHYIDLILTTAWSKQPVAILINDGRGRFSRVETTAYPEAFNAPAKSLASSRLTAVASSPPGPSQAGIGSDESIASHVRPRVGSISPANPIFSPASFLISHAGRAPPFTILAL